MFEYSRKKFKRKVTYKNKNKHTLLHHKRDTVDQIQNINHCPETRLLLYKKIQKITVEILPH